MSVSPRLNRRGATLPLTILLLSLMGVAVAISYSRVSSERRITGDSRAQLGAFAVAQSGLNRFLSTINGKPVGPYPVTVNYNDLPGGTAQVDLRQLRESTITLLPAVYVITSRGTYTGAKSYDALTPAAQRSVATYALWTPASFDLNGAITSLNGMVKSGTSGSMSGYDNCGANPAIPGVSVPGGSDVGGTYSGPVGPIDGSPEDVATNLGTPGSAGTAKDEVDIDWAGIIAGTYLPAGYVLPSWPTAFQMLEWPTIRVNNSAGPEYTLTGDGKGILIVTGDLKINGSLNWQGLILVGGKLTSSGNNTVYGAVVSGLNVKLGVAVAPSDIASGVKTYQYDSCALQRALAKVGSIQRVRNGWNDSWASYQ
jgi:Tfp pilus assembly protein PilX